jgi:hypothetical protein
MFEPSKNAKAKMARSFLSDAGACQSPRAGPSLCSPVLILGCYRIPSLMNMSVDVISVFEYVNISGQQGTPSS